MRINSAAFQANARRMAERLAEVRGLEAKVVAESAAKIDKFEQRGQPLPRERVARLLDRDSGFLELSALAGLGLHDDDGKKSVLDNQVVHFRLAELRTEVEALRALTYHAVELYVSGKDVTKLASMAKLKCGRLVREVADSCLQYWGGMGFTWNNPISQAYRDSRLVSIGGGADEIMLGIICKLEGTLPKGGH